MIFTGIIIPVLTLVVIFLFGIQKFSKQISQVAGEEFKIFLEKMTKKPWRGMALGALFSGLIQSSTATTVILVGLVNAGLVTFSNSLGVILGSNIGSTATSQLVALNLTNIAPYMVLLGFFVTYFGQSYRKWGKPIFYFGLVFFSLSLITLYIEPIKSNPEIVGLFSNISSIYVAVLVGIVFTAIVQSSGVTSGLVVLLVGLGLLNLNQAISIILGANIGTTGTALLASIGTSRAAKKVALAHFLFNVIGVLIFLPFISQFGEAVSSLGGSSQQIVANAHMLFNIACALVFLMFLRPFERLIDWIIVE
jgi:phosphate:Na+ symporter